MTPQEIEQIIDVLVEKLGPIGGQVWAIYIRQVWFEGLLWAFGELIILLLALTALAVAFYGLRRMIKLHAGKSKDMGSDERWEFEQDENFWGWTITAASIGTVVFAGLFLALLSQLLRLVNAEYFAIQMLLGR